MNTEKKARRGGVDYSTISDKRVDSVRFEREKEYKEQLQKKSSGAAQDSKPRTTSTIDALNRMAAGLETRSLADKIADPNRPTWEQYKKDNEDKLDLVGQQQRNMIEYRAKLDAERAARLDERANVKRKTPNSASDSEGEESDDSGSTRSSSHKKRKKVNKKHKKDDKKKKKKHKSRHHHDSDRDHRHSRHDYSN